MDYVNGKIYKIVNNVNDEVYVGSTTQTLAKRFSVHKNDSKKKSKNLAPLYQLMNEIGSENFCISLIKEYPCTTKTELCLEEGKYIRDIGTLNQQIAGRTRKQYYEENKEKELARNNEWRRNNLQKFIIKCACGSKCNRADFCKHTRTKNHIIHVNAIIIQKYFKSWF